jgi:anti-sigma regulatory factor (Ser/Thr protein kinase)
VTAVSETSLVTVEAGDDYAQAVLVPEFRSVTEARHVCARLLRSWHLDDLVDDVELCVTELVTNAILHARTVVTVLLHRHAQGVMVEVRDLMPGAIEIPQPTATGEQPDVVDVDLLLAELGAHGRGLPLVVSVADRVGVDSDAAGKTVWFASGDTTSEADPRHGEGTFDVAHGATTAGQQAHLLEMPVRVVLANVANVDDLYRELQLIQFGADTSEREFPSRLAQQLSTALNRSAAFRLSGRRAARDAAARGATRFSTKVALGATSADQLRRLNALLAEAGQVCSTGTMLSLTPGPDLVAFRDWCADELQRQWHGAPPSPCPLP